MTPGAGHTPGVVQYLIGYDPPNPPDIGCATFMRADTSGHVAVATVHVYDKEFGSELCRRWNAHDDLLAACEALVDAEDERSACDSPEAAANVYHKIEAARAVIAKARGRA